jgi:general secretion pathway protein J
MKLFSQACSRGFTLIEIMVAMFIFGLVVAGVYASWLAIMRGAQTGRKAAAEVQRTRITMATIEEALSSARSFAADIDQYGFEAENGNKAYMTFVAKLAASFPRSGRFDPFDVRRVSFSLEESREFGKELVLRQTPLLMEMDIDEEQHPIILARDVKAFEMEFWDKPSGKWLDEWTQTNALPPMVKVTLKFGDETMNSRIRDELTRVVAIPGITVPRTWQAPQTLPPRGNPPQPIP